MARQDCDFRVRFIDQCGTIELKFERISIGVQVSSERGFRQLYRSGRCPVSDQRQLQLTAGRGLKTVGSFLRAQGRETACLGNDTFYIASIFNYDLGMETHRITHGEVCQGDRVGQLKFGGLRF